MLNETLDMLIFEPNVFWINHFASIIIFGYS